MQARLFKRFLTRLPELTQFQRVHLLALLEPANELQRTIGLIEQTRTRLPACPHCRAISPHRHGQAHGLQRYRCRACHRTFNALTGTPLARLRHKHHWLDYAAQMLESRSIRRAASELDVAGTTSFRWRHRFLALSKHDRPERLSGIVEADEMFVLESQKGSRSLGRSARKRGGKATRRGISNQQVCILVARDRSGQTIDAITGKGPVTTAQLRTHLAPRLAPDVLLVTDAHAAYQRFARAAGIAHEAVNASAGVRTRGALHIQNVNAYHSRVRGWLLGFRGVASRYLCNYFGWHWALDGARIATPDAFLRIALGRFNI